VARSFSPAVLVALRALPSEAALGRLAIHFKADATYHPVRQAASRRWHVRTVCGEFEILTTGVKWYDTRAKKGGGGAIDLAMHLLEVTFVDAVKQLTFRESDRGPGHS
jgi:hypothetical protein